MKLTTYILLLTITSLSVSAHTSQYERNLKDVENQVLQLYDEILNREPLAYEFLELRSYMLEDNWSIHDARRYLRDQQRNSNFNGRPNTQYGRVDEGMAREWVNESFTQYVGRRPNSRELEEYCELVLDDGYDYESIQHRIDWEHNGMNGRYRGANQGQNYYEYQRIDRMISSAYRDTFRSQPDRDQFRDYRRSILNEGWSEAQFKQQLNRERAQIWRDLQDAVTVAYEELLERKPSTVNRDRYVEAMFNDRWSNKQLYDEIRKSREYQYDRPNRIIKAAYRNVLLREVDQGAIEPLRQSIVKQNWKLIDVENNLRKSKEYRTETIYKMIDIAYEEVLNREPDEYGINYYSRRLLEGWTLEDIKEDMRKSDEYREKN